MVSVEMDGWIRTVPQEDRWLTSMKCKNKTPEEIYLLKIKDWFNNLTSVTSLYTVGSQMNLKCIDGIWITFEYRQKNLLDVNYNWLNVTKIGNMTCEELFRYKIVSFQRRK